jgi:hypothetical protein
MARAVPGAVTTRRQDTEVHRLGIHQPSAFGL